jgi:O-antigen ligase
MTNKSDSSLDLTFSSERVDFFDQLLGKAILSVCLFGTVLIWCCIRSYYVNEGREGLSDSVVPLGIKILVTLGLVVPALIAIRKDSQVAWFAGLSGAIGTVPLLPLLPFLREYTHIIVLLWGFTLSASFFARIVPNRVPIFAQCFMLYVATCALSATINFVIFENIWQLKVGVAFLILFGAFVILMLGVVVEPAQAELRFDSLLDGFVWGAFGQAVVALAAIPLLVCLPFSEGNDTVFGLGYYDKYKSTFSGPVSLGMFFVISMPLVLLWMQRKDRASWIATGYFQLMPWFMMATGSRTARIVAVGTFGMLLARPKTRRPMLVVLPSAILAYWVAFKYQSLPAAIFKLLGRNVDPSRDLSDRFFVVTDRIEFIKETIAQMSNAPLILKLLGFGPGTGGYRVSRFPSPHNMFMNQWVETGIIGLLALVAFLVTLAWALWRHARADQRDLQSAWLLLIALFSFAAVCATYAPTYWGYTMVVLLVSISAATAFKMNEEHRLTAG